MTQTKKLTSKQEIERLKASISILDYAIKQLGLSPVATTHNLYQLGAPGQPYDSCIIYPDNSFYRYSSRVGGDIFSFIQEIEEVDFKAALNQAKKYYNTYSPEPLELNSSDLKKQQLQAQSFDERLPKPAQDNKRVFAYLAKTRGINPEIIKEYMKRKLLYQSDQTNNCVWVGEIENQVYYATQRSTQDFKPFKQDIGNFKEVGIYFDYPNSKSLVITESAIDQMSMMNLLDNSKDYSYLSTSGVATVTKAVDLHLKRRPQGKEIQSIMIALDNDVAGQEATKSLVDHCQKHYPEIELEIRTPYQKDFNLDLIQHNTLKNQHYHFQISKPLSPGLTGSQSLTTPDPKEVTKESPKKFVLVKEHQIDTLLAQVNQGQEELAPSVIEMMSQVVESVLHPDTSFKIPVDDLKHIQNALTQRDVAQLKTILSSVKNTIQQKQKARQLFENKSIKNSGLKHPKQKRKGELSR